MSFTNKIKLLKKSELLKVSSWASISTIIRIATQFITAKVLAVMIGPSGIAVLGQLTNVMGMAMVLSTGAISVGVTKYVAEYYYDKKKQLQVIQNAMGLIAICSVLTSILLIVTAPFLSKILFNNKSYSSIISLVGFTISLYAFHTLWLSILNGYNEIKKYVILNIITSIVGLLLTVTLVHFFDVNGSMIAYILGQSVVCVFTYLIINKESWWKGQVKFKFHFESIKPLLGFTLMTLTASLMIPIAQILIRNFITKQISLESAGVWEGMNRISTNYLLLFTSTISVYYLPKLASLQTAGALWGEIKRTYKIILPVLLIVSIMVYLFRYIIIRILFSSNFLIMGDMFSFQLAGDFVKISSWLIGYLMWAKGYVKEFIFTEILFGITLVWITYWGLHLYGLRGTSMAYFINYVLYFICILFLMKYKLNKLSNSQATNVGQQV